jgi:hypothetical protein
VLTATDLCRFVMEGFVFTLSFFVEKKKQKSHPKSITPRFRDSSLILLLCYCASTFIMFATFILFNDTLIY